MAEALSVDETLRAIARSCDETDQMGATKSQKTEDMAPDLHVKPTRD
jgi:hypothetical protein